MKKNLKDIIRPIGLVFLAPVTGFLLLYIFAAVGNIEVPKLLKAVINLIIVSIVAFVLFPRKLGIPFGKIETREFLKRLGFYFPDQAWKHMVLGVVLAVCTLSGMLLASILTGKYMLDSSTINLPQFVFSLNPALWEELFYRGVLMILLLRQTRSLIKASVIQTLLFGLAHIKGFDIWAFVDAFSVVVIAFGFTYVAYKTRALIAGIVFHYFHDALLFFVQLQRGVDSSVSEKLLFYGLLWVMVGVGCLIVRLAAEKWEVRAETELYLVER